MPKIIISIMKYDYGVEERGYSYEYYNIYLPLLDEFGEGNVLLFDYYSEFKSLGKSVMNKNLFEFIKSEKPDIALFVLFEEEFVPGTIASLQEFTKTVIYFIDDPWRTDYVKKWRVHFNFFTTPDYFMLQKYKSENFANTIYSPFGFNPTIFKKLYLPYVYDVSFVGNYSPYRKWVISLLKKEGIKINVFGRGWKNEGGWVSQEKMVAIFNQSRINLNLSNAMYYDIDFLIHSLLSLRDIKELLLLKKNKEQIKGRHYEINGCGGFQLSYFVPGLNMAYEVDKEIAVYENVRNLGSEIKFYLQNEELRKSIANKGYERSITDHKAGKYLKNLVTYILNN